METKKAKIPEKIVFIHPGIIYFLFESKLNFFSQIFSSLSNHFHNKEKNYFIHNNLNFSNFKDEKYIKTNFKINKSISSDKHFIYLEINPKIYKNGYCKFNNIKLSGSITKDGLLKFKIPNLIDSNINLSFSKDRINWFDHCEVQFNFHYPFNYSLFIYLFFKLFVFILFKLINLNLFKRSKFLLKITKDRNLKNYNF